MPINPTIHINTKQVFRDAFYLLRDSGGISKTEMAGAINATERQIDAWLWDAGKSPSNDVFYLLEVMLIGLKRAELIPPDSETLKNTHLLALRFRHQAVKFATRIVDQHAPDKKQRLGGNRRALYESAAHGMITLVEAAKISGLTHGSIWAKMQRGMTIDEAMIRLPRGRHKIGS